MTQKIYGIIFSTSPASATVGWYRSKYTALASFEEDDEDNEDLIITLTFPNELDLETCGFRFRD